MLLNELYIVCLMVNKIGRRSGVEDLGPKARGMDGSAITPFKLLSTCLPHCSVRPRNAPIITSCSPYNSREREPVLFVETSCTPLNYEK